MRTILAFVIVLSAVGCGAKTGGDGAHDMDTSTGPLAGLMSIDVSPATATLTVTNGAAGSTSFSAMGHFADGHSADVTSLVTWSMDNNSLGTIAAGAVMASGLTGGTAKVTATSGSATGTAQLTVKYAATELSTADGSTAPANSAALFTGATTADPTLAPTILYPLDGVVIPNNTGEIEVQWQKPTGAADLFEVALSGPTIDMRIYTNAPETAGGRISISATDWTALSGSTAGTSFTVKVTGMASTDPTKSGASMPSNVTMDANPVNGGIYYWTPTNQGIERHAFGDTSGMATNFYSTTNTGGHCVACHVLSNDGKKAAITFDGGGGGAAVLDVATLTESLPETDGVKFDFATFSPDGSKLAATNDAGALIVYDTSGTATEGTKLNTISPAAGAYYTHPDWSADGKSLVFVQTATTAVMAGDYDFTGGSIVVMTGPGDGTFTNPKVLVQSAGENNYYPSFSPDGKWILFNRAVSGSAYNNPNAEVYVVSADGSGNAIQLTNANATGVLTNSWPRWSPFVQTYPDGSTRLYFTFSSKRNYGIELEQPADTASQRPQIWMSAFSPAQAALNMDPSSAPFWLPFQDIGTNNHIAQWTTQIIAVQ